MNSLEFTRKHQIAQSVAVTVLFAAPALMILYSGFVADPDVWWHLATGRWILEHRSVPTADPFSWTVGGSPWQAYSWLFDLLLLLLQKHVGLAGILLYTVALTVSITAAMHLAIQRVQPDFTVAAVLTMGAMICMSALYTPRSWLFSIVFFVLEWNAILRAREEGSLRKLWWLPLLFALWSNLHIQFVDGLLLLALASIEPWFQRLTRHACYKALPDKSFGLLAACIFAALINPYGWRIYQAAFELASQSKVVNFVAELQAMPFRAFGNFLLLFMVMAAAGVLCWKKRLQFFEVVSLGFGAYLAFRSQRDAWIAAVIATTLVAAHLPSTGTHRRTLPRSIWPGIGFGVVLLLCIGALAFHTSNRQLESKLTKSLPVESAKALEKAGAQAPLFSDYGWGGYLIWATHMRVSIDGRAALYGDPLLERSIKTWTGQKDWASDPALEKACTIIGPVEKPLAQLLRQSADYALMYEDEIAVVFRRSNCK